MDDVGVIRWGKRPWRCGRRWWQWSCGCGWCWCWWWSWRKSQIPGGCLTEALLSVFDPVKSLHVTELFLTLLKVYMSPNSFQPALILFFPASSLLFCFFACSCSKLRVLCLIIGHPFHFVLFLFHIFVFFIFKVRGDICQCRHYRRQCKIFARNNAIYKINESTK